MTAGTPSLFTDGIDHRQMLVFYFLQLFLCFICFIPITAYEPATLTWICVSGQTMPFSSQNTVKVKAPVEKGIL